MFKQALGNGYNLIAGPDGTALDHLAEQPLMRQKGDTEGVVTTLG